jgi:hypothetical protein
VLGVLVGKEVNVSFVIVLMTPSPPPPVSH